MFCCCCMENEIQTEGTYFHTSAIFKRNGWGKAFTFSIVLLFYYELYWEVLLYCRGKGILNSVCLRSLIRWSSCVDWKSVVSSFSNFVSSVACFHVCHYMRMSRKHLVNQRDLIFPFLEKVFPNRLFLQSFSFRWWVFPFLKIS